MITIRKPRMRADTGRPEVGLCAWDVAREGAIVTVDIPYTTKDGRRLWPNQFCISRERIATFPKQVVKGAPLYIVPIDEMREQDPTK